VEIELLVFWAEMRLSYQSLQETHQLQLGPIILYLKICQFPLLKSLQKKKNPVYKKSRRVTDHQKYKANESTNRHNPKKKQKQTINKK